jgi:hypothetical protein
MRNAATIMLRKAGILGESLAKTQRKPIAERTAYDFEENLPPVEDRAPQAVKSTASAPTVPFDFRSRS